MTNVCVLKLWDTIVAVTVVIVAGSELKGRTKIRLGIYCILSVTIN